MTDQPHPAGDPGTAWRRLLARARRAESTVRALRAENTALKALQGTQQHEEQHQ